MFTYTYETRYGDFKTYEIIKPSSLMDIVQDISIRHSDECGYGAIRLRNMNRAWFLQGVKLHFDAPVHTFTPIKVHTAVRNMRGVTSDRGCLLEQEGKVVAKTVASWFVFDVERGRPIRIPTEFAEAYELYDFQDEFFVYTKPELMEAEKILDITVTTKEIDTNHHLNNQKSAEILMSALPFEFEFTDMNVYYKKAVALGVRLELCLRQTDKGYYAHLQTPEGDVCVAAVFEKNKIQEKSLRIG